MGEYAEGVLRKLDARSRQVYADTGILEQWRQTFRVTVGAKITYPHFTAV